MTKASRYYQGPISDHFNGHRFYAPYQAPAKTLLDMLRWSFTSRRARWPRHITNAPAGRPPQRVSGDAIRLTMIGHAATLLQTAGLNILTDPIWSKRASPTQLFGPRRVRDPGIALTDLPPIDLILVTHNHYDHLDIGTLRKLVQQFNPLIVTPLGNDNLIAKAIPGTRLVALDWDQSITIGDLRIEAAPVQHWSSRRLTDRNEALWAGFSLIAPKCRIFVTGDTGFGDGWWAKRAQARYGDFDLALLPIGAYAPRWFMKDFHMNPAEAIQAFSLLGCQQAIGYHQGTFQLTDEAMNEPTQQLQQALQMAGLPPERFITLDPGQFWQKN